MTEALTAHDMRAGQSADLRRARRLSLIGWFLAFTCVVAGAAGGWFVHQGLQPSYLAKTSVLVLPPPGELDSGSGGRGSSEIGIETEAELLRSAQVAATASKSLGGALSESELLTASSVEIPPNTQVLVVAVRTSTPEHARDGSMALANAYVQRRQTQATGEISSIVDSLNEQSAELVTNLKDNAIALAAVPADGTAQRALVESERALLVDQISDINARLVALRIAATPGAEIISEAQLPARPVFPVLLVNLGAGMGLGAVVGAGLLLLTSSWSRRRQRRATPASSLDFPLLAKLAPNASPMTNMAFSDLEVLGRIRDQVIAGQDPRGPIAVLAVGDPASCSHVTLGLAESWAEGHGSSIVVMTAASGLMPSVGGSSDEAGLSEALRGESSLWASSVALPGLRTRVMGAGRYGEDLASAPRGELTKIWGQLAQEFGTVLVQSASLPDSAIARSVAQTAGAIIVVVENGMTQTREFTATLEKLAGLGLSARVAGVITVSDRPLEVPDQRAGEHADQPVRQFASGFQGQRIDMAGVIRERG